MSTGRATLNELSTVYGIRDCYDILEVEMIDLINSRSARIAAAKARV